MSTSERDPKDLRLRLIRKRAQYLQQRKRIGFEPTREYQVHDLVYDQGSGRFGWVANVTNDRVEVDVELKVVRLRRASAAKRAEAARAVAAAVALAKGPAPDPAAVAANPAATSGPVSAASDTAAADNAGLRRNFIWKPEDDQFLTANLNKPNKWLAEQLNTSVGSVKGRIRRLRDSGALPRAERQIEDDDSVESAQDTTTSVTMIETSTVTLIESTGEVRAESSIEVSVAENEPASA